MVSGFIVADREYNVLVEVTDSAIVESVSKLIFMLGVLKM